MSKQNIEDGDIDLNLARKRPDRFLRVYPKLDVNLTYQNFGSTRLCVLRGSSENIELVFNGLYNYGATNGDYQFYDHADTVAIFWTNEEALTRCLYRMAALSPQTNWQGKARNKAIAKGRIAYLREHCHEPFMDFANMFIAEAHGTGSITAERPDMDMKDAILAHAFTDAPDKKVNVLAE